MERGHALPFINSDFRKPSNIKEVVVTPTPTVHTFYMPAVSRDDARPKA